MTGAHRTGHLAELVCSNSFKSKLATSPAGQLKGEMAALGSIVLPTAEEHAVPGGEALAVDRDAFAAAMTERIERHPLIRVMREEFTPGLVPAALEAGPLIVATGPLTSPALAEWLASLTGRSHLYFYDAVSPTVDASTLDRTVVFAQSRYDKGEGDDYLNCPFDKESYGSFVRELVAAERARRTASTPKTKPWKRSSTSRAAPPSRPSRKAASAPSPSATSSRWASPTPHGTSPVRRAPAPPGEPGEDALPSSPARTAWWGEQKRVFRMVPSGERGVRPLRRHPPEHLHRVAPRLRALAGDARAAEPVRRRASSRASRATSSPPRWASTRESRPRGARRGRRWRRRRARAPTDRSSRICRTRRRASSRP